MEESQAWTRHSAAEKVYTTQLAGRKEWDRVSRGGIKGEILIEIKSEQASYGAVLTALGNLERGKGAI